MNFKSGGFEVNFTKIEVQSAICEVKSGTCEVQFTRLEVQTVGFEVQFGSSEAKSIKLNFTGTRLKATWS